MATTSQIEIYQATDGSTQIGVQLEQGTVWLTQAQMAELFHKDVRTISEHIQNIYSSEELLSDSTIRNFRIVRQECDVIFGNSNSIIRYAKRDFEAEISSIYEASWFRNI